MIWLAMLVLGEQAPLTPVTVRNESELLTSDDYLRSGPRNLPVL